MPATIKYNWPEAEQTFMQAPDVHPRVSLRDISEQFRIPYQTVRRYAAQHKWNSRRDNAYYEIRKAKFPVKQQQRHFYTAGRGMPKEFAAMLNRLNNA